MNRQEVEFAPGIAARGAAQSIVGEVLRRRRPLDAVLEETLSAAALSVRDAGFARAIAGETLRRFGELESLLRAFVPKTPPPHRAGATLEIMLAAACEILFLDVPAHAAVDAANRLAQRDSKAVHFKPLINAALRRIAQEGPSISAGQDAERLNTPDWLWQRWCMAFGETTTRAIARAHVAVPPLDIILKDPYQRREAMPHFPPPSSPAVEDNDAESSKQQTPSTSQESKRGASFVLPGGVVRLNHAGAVESLRGFVEGNWWVQDFAASLPVRLFGDVRGKSVIDLCAAPGGKTAQLAAAGAKVAAVEMDASRLARLESNLDRLKLSASLVHADIRDFVPRTKAECVLLDAPCSATGTIRRHPDLPWIKGSADVTASARSTGALLDAAAEMVAREGLLVFAVCSLEAEEGVEQVGDFLVRHANFRREPITSADALGMAELVSAEGDLRTLPCHLAAHGGMDGFYATRLRRQ